MTTDPDTLRVFIQEYQDCKVVLELPKGYLEEITQAAADAGQSVNAYISQAISERMSKQ